MKILLVDDSLAMRRIERNILTELGYADIMEANNGAEALETIKTAAVDLVLLDWNMPVMDGMQLLRQLKASAAYKAIPVVMVTSESEKNRIVEAIRAGAAQYILKPFSKDIIREKLSGLLVKKPPQP